MRNDIVANYISTAYCTGLAFVSIPFYLNFLGVEGYAVIAFASLVYYWTSILDAGLTPMFTKQTADAKNGICNPTDYYFLLKFIKLIFIFFGILIFSCSLIFVEKISNLWLGAAGFTSDKEKFYIISIGIIAVLKLQCTFYRSIIYGFDKIKYLAVLNAIFATIRVLPLVLLWYIYSANLTSFFELQIVAGVLESVVCFFYSKRLNDKHIRRTISRPNMQYVISSFRFAGNIGLTSILWVLATQIDKSIVATIVSLEQFGIFNLVLTASSSIVLIGAPITHALLPKFVDNCKNSKYNLAQNYTNTINLVSYAVSPLCVFLIINADYILNVWTGIKGLDYTVGKTLGFYVFGNLLVVLGGVSYMVQYSTGNLKLHTIGSIIYVAILLPLVYFCVQSTGIIGAGYAWLAANIFQFLVWLPFVHKRIFPNIGFIRFFKKPLLVFLGIYIVGQVIYNLFIPPDNKIGKLVYLVVSILLLYLLSFSFYKLNNLHGQHNKRNI